jgi:hypothetical protein
VSGERNFSVGNQRFTESAGLTVRIWTTGQTLVPLFQTNFPVTATAFPPGVRLSPTESPARTRTGYGGNRTEESAGVRSLALIKAEMAFWAVVESSFKATKMFELPPEMRNQYTKSVLTELWLIPTGRVLAVKEGSAARISLA